MADNLVIESPDFERIKKESGFATSDAMRLLWFALNNEIAERRTTTRDAKDVDEGRVKSDAPTTQQNDYDSGRVTTVYFTGASAWTLTGLRNGLEGRRIELHNIGAGNVTLANNSASSQTTNRLLMSTGANKILVTDTSTIFTYLSGRWRELKLL